MRPIIQGAKYLTVHVRDIQKARAFYTNALGVKEVGYYEPGKFASLELPDGNILVIHQFQKADDCFPGSRPVGGATGIAFGVDDAVGSAKAWKASGGTVTMQPEKMPWGEVVGFVADPDGNEFAFNQG